LPIHSRSYHGFGEGPGIAIEPTPSDFPASSTSFFMTGRGRDHHDQDALAGFRLEAEISIGATHRRLSLGLPAGSTTLPVTIAFATSGTSSLAGSPSQLSRGNS
jgi:hypothetical protein